MTTTQTNDMCKPNRNISGELREAIESRFRSGVVGRNVFDEVSIQLTKH